MQSLKSTIYTAALVFRKEFFSECALYSPEITKRLDDALLHYLKALLLFLDSGKAGNGVEPAGNELIASIVAVLSVEEFEKRIKKQETAAKLKLLQKFLSEQYAMLSNRKKIVILTINAGNGHKSAAYAMEKGFRELHGHDYLVSVQDVQVDVNTLYESSVKFTPQVYKWVFDTTDSIEGMTILHSIGYPMFAKKLDKILETERPDAIVSTYCFPGINTWLEKSLRAKENHIPFVSIVTDSITVHHMWFGEEMDYYVVSNADTKNLMISKGVASQKIKVLGFPVNPAFYEPLDRKEALKAEGLDPKKPTFLVSIGTAASSKEVAFLTKFKEELSEKANLIVATGKNESIYKTLSKKDFGSSIKLLGWTNQMYKYLQMADVAITKAGGATVMECVALKKPMIITKVLPGQEEGNALLVEKYGLGIVLRKKDNIIDAMREFVDSPSRIRDTQKNFAPIWQDDATYKIVDFLTTLV